MVAAAHDDAAALRLAVRDGDVPAVAAILDRHPELVRATDDLDPDPEERERPVDTRGMHLLRLAVAEDRLDVLLIERGADLDARNADGRAALHDAFELNRSTIAKLLIDAGATIDVCAAVAYHRHDRLRALLRADPAQANDLTTKLSPLGWAASMSRAKVRARSIASTLQSEARPLTEAQAVGGG